MSISKEIEIANSENAINSIKLYKILSSAFSVDDLCYMIIEYLEKNLWEYNHRFMGNNRNVNAVNHVGFNEISDIFASWSEFVKFSNTYRYHPTHNCIPVHFAWICDSSTFYVESLYINFLGNYCVSVKVSKDDETQIREYLRSACLLNNK